MRKKMEIGEILGDFEIIDKIKNNLKYEYLMRCKVCGEEFTITNGSDYRKTQPKHLSSRACKKDYDLGDFEFLKKEEKKIILKCKICGELIKISNLSYYNKNSKHGDSNQCKKEKIVGTKIGDFVIMKELDKYKFLVQCAVCGKEKEANLTTLKSTGNTHKSCSKLKSILGERGHGIRSDRRFYGIWKAMHVRTTNKKQPGWENYGGRGISSEYYKDFEVFYEELYEPYKVHKEIHGEQNTSLDRINVDGNYEKNNCKWSTRLEQNTNQRNTKTYVLTNKKTNETHEVVTAKQVGVFLKIEKCWAYTNIIKKGETNEYIIKEKESK